MGRTESLNPKPLTLYSNTGFEAPKLRRPLQNACKLRGEPVRKRSLRRVFRI